MAMRYHNQPHVLGPDGSTLQTGQEFLDFVRGTGIHYNNAICSQDVARVESKGNWNDLNIHRLYLSKHGASETIVVNIIQKARQPMYNV
jgi:hypothetical protein